MTQIGHVVESKRIKCYRLSSLVATIALVYVVFVSPPRITEEKVVENFLVTQILFFYILLEFLYFSWIVVTRIARLLGIMVFKSGKIRADPVE